MTLPNGIAGKGGDGAFPFGFDFAPPFGLDFAPFPCPFPFGLAYGVNEVEDAEVLAGPYLGGGPVACNGLNGAHALGLLVGAGLLGGGGPGFVGPCVSAS